MIPSPTLFRPLCYLIARNFGRSLTIPGQFCKRSVTFPAHASIEMYGVKFIFEYHKSEKVAI